MNSDSKNSVDYNLLAKYFAGSANNLETQEIDTWRQASEQNSTEFHELQLVWLDTGALIKPDSSSVKVDIDSAWQKLNNKIETESKVIPITDKRNNSKNYTQIAAAIAILFASYLAFNLLFADKEVTKLASKDEVVTQELTDGTRVTLNEETTLIYPDQYAENIREVKLDGEAFFEVERDTLKPFIIQAGQAQITVLGTSFNVDAFSDENFVTVTVETGKVKLSFEENEAILTPGMTGVLDKSSRSIDIISDSDGNEDAWRDHNLVFRRTKLKNVVNTLNDLYDVNIKIGSESIEDCKLSAKFDDETIENILDIIVSTFDLEMTKVDDKTILNGDGC